MEHYKEYYTTGDVAKLFGVSVSAVQYWIKRGKIKAIKTPGGQYRIPKEELERFIGT